MGMDNKFVVIDKSRKNLEELHKFIRSIIDSDENDSSKYKMSTYDFNIKEYGEYWGLEGEFRNTVMSDLEYWLKLKDKESLVSDSIMVIHYEYVDYVAMLLFDDAFVGEKLFELYEDITYPAGEAFNDIVPIEKLKKYFHVHYN